MKKVLLFIFSFITICASAQIAKVIPSRPNPPKLVNDFTGTLTPEQVQALEAKLVAYDDSTSSQIAVVLVKTIQDYPVEEVALGILRNWGVGGKGNNGIVVLVAKDDHKARIEVGYGLEGAIPDVTAKTIVDNDLLPNFRQDNYYRGLDEATDDIIKAAAGEYKAPAGYGNKGSKGKGLGGLVVFLIILFLFIGGAGGRGGGGMASRRGFRGFGAGWIIGSLLSGGGGGSSGGGWSGGGGGGGGFGGFGGGSGGGGGASGSW